MNMRSRIRRILSPAPQRRGSPAITGLAGGFALAAVIAAIAVGQLSTGIAQEENAGAAKADQDGPRIQVSPGESIQKAIDDAEEGAIIVLAKGTYADPPLRIDKALTLEGAGWDQTILQPAEEADAKPTPTITITGAKDVVIRGLRASRSVNAQKVATGAAAGGGVSSDPIIAIQASEVSIEASAIVGPSGNGVTIAGASKVRMSESLVAAIWGTGVRVEGGADAASAPQLHMNKCVVRNCYHRCVTIGANSNDTVIEGSWISGSAWHGIRYDHAAPRIERNVIFSNAGPASTPPAEPPPAREAERLHRQRDGRNLVLVLERRLDHGEHLRPQPARGHFGARRLDADLRQLVHR